MQQNSKFKGWINKKKKCRDQFVKIVKLRGCPCKKKKNPQKK